MSGRGPLAAKVWAERCRSYAMTVQRGDEPIFLSMSSSDRDQGAAQAMREQYDELDDDTQETVRKLLSEWEGTWEELVEVAGAL